MSDVTITPGGHTHAQGQGDYRYELVEGWEQLPSGWTHGDVAGVATDSQDRVYVFNRSEHPVIVYDRDGHVPRRPGARASFTRPHGITIVGRRRLPAPTTPTTPSASSPSTASC